MSDLSTHPAAWEASGEVGVAFVERAGDVLVHEACGRSVAERPATELAPQLVRIALGLPA